MASETELSMLWESVDSSTALSARFGFVDADHAVSWLAETIAAVWARRLDRCDRLVISASNLLAWLTVDGQEVIAKCCVDPARFSKLAAVDALVGWLESERVPVAAPIVARDGRQRVEADTFSLGLYPFIEGGLLDVGDEGQVEAAGRMLAQLHEALAAYPRSFGGGLSASNQQLVHGDFRSANILHDGLRITAVLDFEEVTSGSRVADLARATVLLGTRYHDWKATSPGTRHAFVAAYDEVAPLTGAQRSELHRSIAQVFDHFGWA
ncbi:phosphotransferase enzyme family protein [Flexivirga sp.]|uniref:phosphotransferase enzyme family protein n=1 Tax=Flexivirga sp. TaxID=1962927 RepID=UPI003F81F112